MKHTATFVSIVAFVFLGSFVAAQECNKTGVQCMAPIDSAWCHDATDGAVYCYQAIDVHTGLPAGPNACMKLDAKCSYWCWKNHPNNVTGCHADCLVNHPIPAPVSGCNKAGVPCAGNHALCAGSNTPVCKNNYGFWNCGN